MDDHDDENENRNNRIHNIDVEWDEVARVLQESGGVCQVPLRRFPSERNDRHVQWDRVFALAREAMDCCREQDTEKGNDDRYSMPYPLLGPHDDPTHATGYHGAGCLSPLECSGKGLASGRRHLSRYNEFREGLVWSNGAEFGPAGGGFRTTMADAYGVLFQQIVDPLLGAVARRLGLPSPSSDDDEDDEDECDKSRKKKHWFDEHVGPFPLSSQWHIKRYVPSTISSSRAVILPKHTDPSIVSIIVHDCSGTNPGGYGLQWLDMTETLSSTSTDTTKNRHDWKDLESHGHQVATIFVGSVLSLITRGVYRAACHRVIAVEDVQHDIDRVALTLFVRPRMDAQIIEVPSSMKKSQDKNEEDVHVHLRRSKKLRGASTFGAWYSRVSKNYGR